MLHVKGLRTPQPQIHALPTLQPKCMSHTLSHTRPCTSTTNTLNLFFQKTFLFQPQHRHGSSMCLFLIFRAVCWLELFVEFLADIQFQLSILSAFHSTIATIKPTINI